MEHILPKDDLDIYAAFAAIQANEDLRNTNIFKSRS